MKSKEEILDSIVKKLGSGERIILTGIDSDFCSSLPSEIENIVKGALNVFYKEVVGSKIMLNQQILTNLFKK